MSETVCDVWALQEVRELRFLINRCDEWIYDEIVPYLGQRVLEIGCGLGNLICHLTDRELVVGIDPESDCIEHLHSVYSGTSNVQAFALDICDPHVLELKHLRFDTVVSLNVLEHIQDDVGFFCSLPRRDQSQSFYLDHLRKMVMFLFECIDLLLNIIYHPGGCSISITIDVTGLTLYNYIGCEGPANLPVCFCRPGKVFHQGIVTDANCLQPIPGKHHPYGRKDPGYRCGNRQVCFG